MSSQETVDSVRKLIDRYASVSGLDPVERNGLIAQLLAYLAIVEAIQEQNKTLTEVLVVLKSISKSMKK